MNQQLTDIVNQGPYTLADELAMQDLGKTLAAALPEKCLITLSGELGAGKSVLVRAIIHALGYTGRVKSPTYTLIEQYRAPGLAGQSINIAHLDLYRLVDADELSYLGFDDVLETSDLLLIEWPERCAGRLPAADLQVAVSYLPDNARRVELSLAE